MYRNINQVDGWHVLLWIGTCYDIPSIYGTYVCKQDISSIYVIYVCKQDIPFIYASYICIQEMGCPPMDGDVLITNINHVDKWDVLFTSINHVDG
jgi:hypothetical protein